MIREVDNNGRCVIPSEMRKALGIENGGKIKFELDKSWVKISNPDNNDFENWIKDYILKTESMEAQCIYEKYQELTR